MKDYRISSKIAVALCVCVIILTAVNFFTGGIINSTMSGSSYVICCGLPSAVIMLITIEEKKRLKTKSEE